MPLYKMARKPVPHYVDAPPPAQAIMIEDIKHPVIDYHSSSASATPQYRIFPGPSDLEFSRTHNNPWIDTFYPLTQMSTGRVTTGTQELAEFLKSSKPEDFGARQSGSADELSLSGSNGPKKRRFLRISTPREHSEKPRIQSPSPLRLPHVVSKTTSQGNPYLQIQVDYHNCGTSSNAQMLETTTDNGNTNIPTLDAVNLYYDQVAAKKDSFYRKNSSNPSMTTPLASPPPWSPPEPQPSIAATDAYQNFLCPYAEPSPKPQKKAPMLPLLQTDFEKTQGPIPQIQDRTYRAPHSPHRDADKTDRISSGSTELGSYYSSQVQQEPLSRNYHDQLIRPSAKQAHTVDEKASSVEGIKIRKLTRPGPPPNKGLPSLPEVHDISTLSGRSVIPHQGARRSQSPMLASPLEEDGIQSIEKVKRGERVKARKVRDMKAIQQKKLQEALRLLDVDAEGKEKVFQGPSTVSPVSPMVGLTENGSQKATANDSTSGTKASSTVHAKHQLHINTHDAPTPPHSPSPVSHQPSGREPQSMPLPIQSLANPMGTSIPKALEASTARQKDLEDRLEMMERKYMILEQALITVLQRTCPHRSESSSIESLLADFRLAHPGNGWANAFPLEKDLKQNTGI
ncbi:hypothetical protein BDZ91DRAFT_441958 [Kalaharituber pfeilii]|nr:hypothetical protein BDZ91DRAFT_441958 [Kalaharituber pfeilii]